MQTQDHKICNDCQEDKPLTEYHKNGAGRFGRHNVCKICRSKARKELRFNRVPKGTMVFCNRCKETKDEINFSSDITRTGGLQTYCKTCQTDMLCKYWSTFNGFMKRLFKDSRRSAQERELAFTITHQDLLDCYDEQDGLCNLTGVKLTHNSTPGLGRNKHPFNISVDRIDSSRGYERNNIQLVCTYVNTIKWDLPQDNFFKVCKRIVTYREEVKGIPIDVDEL